MRPISVTAKLSNTTAPEKGFEAIFSVDADAMDTMVPADELIKLGIIQEGKMSYELADGTVEEYPYGLARIEFIGEITAGRVVFDDLGSEPLLGVTALESIGIVIDPVTRTLKRQPAIPLK